MIHSCTRVWRQLLRHNIKDKEKKVKVTESTESIYTSRERFDRMLPYVEYITTCLAYSNTPPPSIVVSSLVSVHPGYGSCPRTTNPPMIFFTNQVSRFFKKQFRIFHWFHKNGNKSPAIFGLISAAFIPRVQSSVTDVGKLTNLM